MWMCHPHERPLSSSHQGVDGHTHITTPISPQQDEIASLWTVPVWNSTNGKRIKVNALFADAISVWYVNEELAGVPRLSVKYEEVTVNFLNDTVQTFDGMLINEFRKLWWKHLYSSESSDMFPSSNWKLQSSGLAEVPRLMASLTCMQISWTSSWSYDSSSDWSRPDWPSFGKSWHQRKTRLTNC